MASPGRSVTGSFDHGVSAFSRLLRAHVKPAPSAETLNPKSGFAMTLIHGAGVVWPPRAITTYSRPCSANPPLPLKNSRLRADSLSAGAGAATGCGDLRGCLGASAG